MTEEFAPRELTIESRDAKSAASNKGTADLTFNYNFHAGYFTWGGEFESAAIKNKGFKSEDNLPEKAAGFLHKRRGDIADMLSGIGRHAKDGYICTAIIDYAEAKTVVASGLPTSGFGTRDENELIMVLSPERLSIRYTDNQDTDPAQYYSVRLNTKTYCYEVVVEEVLKSGEVTSEVLHRESALGSMKLGTDHVKHALKLLQHHVDMDKKIAAKTQDMLKSAQQVLQAGCRGR